jgi:hypothetical protein
VISHRGQPELRDYYGGFGNLLNQTVTKGTAPALLATDLNGDGLDEIVAGYRGTGGKTYIYSADTPDGSRWTREILDGSLPAAACAVADLNGDGRPDLACIGGASLKWYENLGTGR